MWANLLGASGGALKFSKCSNHLVHWHFTTQQGDPVLIGNCWSKSRFCLLTRSRMRSTAWPPYHLTLPTRLSDIIKSPPYLSKHNSSKCGEKQREHGISVEVPIDTSGNLDALVRMLSPDCGIPTRMLVIDIRSIRSGSAKSNANYDRKM